MTFEIPAVDPRIMPDAVYRRLARVYFGPDRDERVFEQRMIELLRTADSYVDVGASFGRYVRLALSVMRPGVLRRIAAFEADPARWLVLRRYVEMWNNGAPHVEVLPVAVTDRLGQVEMILPGDGRSGGEYLSIPGPLPRLTVLGVRLDDVIDWVPDVVKIDVEGSELRVLRGAERIVALRQTTWAIELHDAVDPISGAGKEDVIRWLDERGYSAEETGETNRWIFRPRAS